MESSLKLLDYLFAQVWVNAKMVAEATAVSQPTAYKIIERFVQNGLLNEMTGAKRDRIFRFDAYLKIYQHPKNNQG